MKAEELEVLEKVYLEAREKGRLIGEHRLILAKKFGKRFENAWKAVVEGAVKKYVFEPSGRIVWIVVGRERDYQVLPEVNYCTCEDYYFRVLDGEILLCYHLLAQKLAEALGKYEEIKESDSLYETLTAEWRFIKKEWYTEET